MMSGEVFFCPVLFSVDRSIPEVSKLPSGKEQVSKLPCSLGERGGAGYPWNICFGVVAVVLTAFPAEHWWSP